MRISSSNPRSGLARALLALLTLCGSTPGAVSGLGVGANPPGGAGVQFGGDGVGGIEKSPPLRPMPTATTSTLPSKGDTTPLAQPGNGGYGPWTDLGAGLADSSAAPALVGDGDALPSTAVELRLSGAPAHAGALLVIGTDSADLAFHGGVMVPRPDLVVAGLSLDADGALTLSTVMPAGMASGVTLYMQVWIPDSSAPTGWVATNALRLITP